MNIHSTIKLAALAVMILGSVACNKEMEFQKLSMSGAGHTSVDAPEGNDDPIGECDASEVIVTGPSHVDLGETFTLSVNRPFASWEISRSGQSIHREGSSITLTLNEIGVYSVFVVATDVCGGQLDKELIVTVDEPVTVPPTEPEPEPEPPVVQPPVVQPPVTEPPVVQPPVTPEPPVVQPPVVQPPVTPEPPVVQPPVVTGGKGDILFVVHNGFTMYDELRDTIPYRFKDFVANLKGDYRIGITTGDAQGVRPFESGGLADVLRTPVEGPGIALVPRQKIISSAMGEYASRNFLATLMRPESICIQVTTGRCPNYSTGYQQGIKAAMLAIDRPDNQVHFRGDVPLHIIIIGDKDESSNDTEAPEKLIAKVQSKWPGRQLKVHTVIRKTSDQTCSYSGVEARQAPIYQRLSEVTGGISTSICKGSDRKDIKAIVDEINK